MTAPHANTLAGLYLHIPFCTSVCPYCDYAVLIAYQERRAAFVESLVAEIGLQRGNRLCFDTIYLGGGTPSCLTPAQLERLLGEVSRTFCLHQRPRLFLEANPEDVTAEAIRAWRSLGLSTLSIGAQSLDDQVLRRLGRRHTAVQARLAMERARAAGLETVSLDLIYGFPGHERAAWRQQLLSVLQLRPDHLSCYQLTVHEGTVLGKQRQRGQLYELPEQDQAELFLLTHELLGEHGLEGYEVSNFAAGPAHRSRHNQKYWQHAPYLGLGPSAHSYGGNRRWWNHRKLRRYQAAIRDEGSAVAGEEQLDPAELTFEAVMLGLRTTDGIDTATIRQRWGIDLLAANRELVGELCQEGLLRCSGQLLQPTLAGMAVADAIACRLEVPEPPGPPA